MDVLSTGKSACFKITCLGERSTVSEECSSANITQI